MMAAWQYRIVRATLRRMGSRLPPKRMGAD